MLWSRYKSTLLWSVPIGIAVGCVLSLTVYLTGNPDYRDQGGWGAFVYSLATGAVIGGVTALAALIGGVLAVLLIDRRASRAPSARIRGGSFGAAVGAGTLWLAIGAGDALTAPFDGSWVYWVPVAAGVSALFAGFAALLMLQRAERAATTSQ